MKSKGYITIVRPQLEYAGYPRNTYTKQNINKIEMVQHNADRFVLHDYSRLSHVTPMINQLGWDTLEQSRLLSQLTIFYKIQQGLMGIPLPPEVFPLNRASRLPNCTPYHHIQCNCNVYKFSFYPRSIVVWNRLSLKYFTTAERLFLNQQVCPLLDIWYNFYLKYVLFSPILFLQLFIYLFIHSSLTYSFIDCNSITF